MYLVHTAGQDSRLGCPILVPNIIGLHLEPRFLVYAWYMPGIFHPYAILIHMDGIYMGYTWYIHGISMAMDIPYISKDIHGISILYMDGIYLVYPWYIN